MEREIERTGLDVDPAGLAEILAAPRPVRLIDVREESETRNGWIPGAVKIPLGTLAAAGAGGALGPTPLVLYCAGGVRSRLALRELQTLGYTDVRSLKGGIAAWERSGLPVVAAPELSPEDRRRYARHLAIPEVGAAGQRKLLDAKVLIVGAGGLGSPAALYLAAAGVGRLGIVDFDRVEESNLQRQILHGPSRVGWLKTDSALHTLRENHPRIVVDTYPERFTEENAERILGAYDLVVDGSDNFSTRYLINDVAARLGKPVVYGAVQRFEGQVSVFDAAKGPCYRCLFPEPPPPGAAPSCAEAGVLGVLPGLIGVAQATETIKILLGIGQPLIGRLVIHDALAGEFRGYTVERDPHCRHHGATGL